MKHGIVWLLFYDLILKSDLDTAKMYLKTETKVPIQFRTGIKPGTSDSEAKTIPTR